MPSWFDGARFGMFVHWGHSSQRGVELSWPLVGGVAALPGSADVPADEYHATAASFEPQPGRRARLAGARAPRGHALRGAHRQAPRRLRALADTATGGLSIADSKYRGDLVREFVDAARANGLRVGLYFSLCRLAPSGLPALPRRASPVPVRARAAARREAQWARFLEFQFAQLRELLTRLRRASTCSGSTAAGSARPRSGARRNSPRSRASSSRRSC